MVNSNRIEVSFYPEILAFFKEQLLSNFQAMGMPNLHVYGKIGEMSSKLREIIVEDPEYCNCLIEYADKLSPLNLDIFLVISDKNCFEILILEIKYRASVGLNEWSQLIGYNIVSNAQYGLLINVDGAYSERLREILEVQPQISDIITFHHEEKFEHKFGLMNWNSASKNVEYSNLGNVFSIPHLCADIAEKIALKRSFTKGR